MSHEKDALGPAAIANVTAVDQDATGKPILADSISDGKEKENISSIKETVASSTEEAPYYDANSEEFAEIPELVRNIVSFEDDPTLPVITFRSVLLSVVFCVIGSFVSQLS